MSVARRRAAAVVLAAVAALAAGCDRAPARPAAAPSGPVTLRDSVTIKAADALCAAENQQEMGTSRLGKLYGARTGGYLTVQRLESQARRELRAAPPDCISRLPSGSD